MNGRTQKNILEPSPAPWPTKTQEFHSPVVKAVDARIYIVNLRSITRSGRRWGAPSLRSDWSQPFQPTIQPTRLDVLYDFRELRQSPRSSKRVKPFRNVTFD